MNEERIQDALTEAIYRSKAGHKGKNVYALNYYEDLTEEEKAEVRKRFKERNHATKQ